MSLFKPKVYVIMEAGGPVAAYATESLARANLRGSQYVKELPYVEYPNYLSEPRPPWTRFPFLTQVSQPSILSQPAPYRPAPSYFPPFSSPLHLNLQDAL